MTSKTYAFLSVLVPAINPEGVVIGVVTTSHQAASDHFYCLLFLVHLQGVLLLVVLHTLLTLGSFKLLQTLLPAISSSYLDSTFNNFLYSSSHKRSVLLSFSGGYTFSLSHMGVQDQNGTYDKHSRLHHGLKEIETNFSKWHLRLAQQTSSWTERDRNKFFKMAPTTGTADFIID